jgi:alpha-D-ribose 1-methylphosphonate 5-triphosphate synthase subunit PhnI
MWGYQGGVSQMQPVLKEIVVEASRALAQLDADRLEELALSCQALNKDVSAGTLQDRSLLAKQVREASGDMAVFSRILDATRANLDVLNRARERRTERLEYGQPLVRNWVRAENGHGDN